MEFTVMHSHITDGILNLHVYSYIANEGNENCHALKWFLTPIGSTIYLAMGPRNFVELPGLLQMFLLLFYEINGI